MLRAIFGILLALLLIPHEPDIGFGRPGINLPLDIRTLRGRLLAAIDRPTAIHGGHEHKPPVARTWSIRIEIPDWPTERRNR